MFGFFDRILNGFQSGLFRFLSNPLGLLNFRNS
jgi:hypothetical protein